MSPGETTNRFREFARRSHEVIVLAAITGVVTGFAVAAFDRIVVDGILDHLFELSPWVLAFMPLVGLTLSWLALFYVARSRDSGMTDLYLKAFHDPEQPLRVREFPGRVLAAIATPAFGGAMGLEGASLYLGSFFGSFLQRALPALHRREQPPGPDGRGRGRRASPPSSRRPRPARSSPSRCRTRKTWRAACCCRRWWRRRPATSRSSRSTTSRRCSPRTARRHRSRSPTSPARSCSVSRRASARGRSRGCCSRPRRSSPRFDPWVRIVSAGLTIAALFGITWLLTDQPLAIGVGYHTIEWALHPNRALWLLAVVLLVRCLATAATVAGSGVGGLFIPLVVAGALLGRIAVGVVGDANTTLFVVDRRRRVPRRRLPGAAGGGDVRGRDHRPARLHRARAPGGGRGDAGDGPGIGHHLPAGVDRRASGADQPRVTAPFVRNRHRTGPGLPWDSKLPSRRWPACSSR